MSAQLAKHAGFVDGPALDVVVAALALSDGDLCHVMDFLTSVGPFREGVRATRILEVSFADKGPWVPLRAGSIKAIDLQAGALTAAHPAVGVIPGSKLAVGISPSPHVLTADSHSTPTFNCGSRVDQKRLRGGGELQDGWNVHPNGDCTCSFCGSISPEGFLAAALEAADPANPTRISPSTKHYKIYLHRQGITNASQGAIKHYAWHCGAPSSQVMGMLQRVVPKAL